MILGAEIALIVMGVYALITGKLLTSKKSKYVLQGWPARVIGLICLLPIPLAFVTSVVVATIFLTLGKPVNQESFFLVGAGIEIGVLILCVIVVTILERTYRTPVQQAQQLEPSAAEGRL